MTMLPQPPPGAPAPPPSAPAIRSRRFLFGIWIFGVASVVVVVLGLWNVILTQRNLAIITEAHSNLRSLSFALGEFEAEYGRYPDTSTIDAVRERTGRPDPMGAGTANGFLGQLIVAEIQGSEGICFAAIPGAHKPDNRVDGTHLLEKGECGFSYIVGQSSENNPSRPLVVTPLIPGTDRFDPKPFNGKAIVLQVGGGSTVSVLSINKNGEVIDSSGKHILDPANPIWGGEKPVIAWPDL